MQTAKTAAYQLLAECGISKFPLTLPDLKEIVKQKGWYLKSYQADEEYLREMNLAPLASQYDAFVFQYDGDQQIFYDENLGADERLYIIAHEIGHIALDHKDHIGISAKSNEDTPLEHDAEIFATCLLAPPCIVKQCTYSKDYLGGVRIISALQGNRAGKAASLVDFHDDSSEAEEQLKENCKKYTKYVRKKNSPVRRSASIVGKVLLVIAIAAIVVHRVGVEYGFFSRVVSSWNETPAEAITRNAGKYD